MLPDPPEQTLQGSKRFAAIHLEAGIELVGAREIRVQKKGLLECSFRDIPVVLPRDAELFEETARTSQPCPRFGAPGFLRDHEPERVASGDDGFAGPSRHLRLAFPKELRGG